MIKGLTHGLLLLQSLEELGKFNGPLRDRLLVDPLQILGDLLEELLSGLLSDLLLSQAAILQVLRRA